MNDFIESSYTSCIRFNGRSILPPIMTPCISKEMARFRQLAVDVEKRIKDNKQILRTVSSDLKDEQPSMAVSSPLNFVDVAHIYSPPDIISIPPSVASTYLARYMQTESDLEGHLSSTSMDVNYANSSRSNTSTTLIDDRDALEDNTEVKAVARDLSEEEQDPDVFSPSNRVRKLSYTLDQPSPILMAQLKHLKVTETEIVGVNEQLTTEDGQSLDLSKLSGVEIDSESGTYCTAAGTSSQSEASGVRMTRNEHLQRYLQQVQDLNSETHDLQEWMVSNGTNSRIQNADDCMGHGNGTLSTVDDSDASYIYDKVLLEQERHYEKLRIEMEEQHRTQMDQLKRQRDTELGIMRTHLMTKGQEKLDGVVSSTTTTSSMLNTGQKYYVHPTEPHRSQSPVLLPNQGYHRSEICETNMKDARNASVEMDLDTNKRKFDRVSAAVKGYLVRRLFRTEKIQHIIKTIKDTLEFALQFHSETPIKQGRVTPEDATLNERILAQLSSACFEFHDIFITFPVKERMAIIAQDRAFLQEKLLQEKNDPAQEKFGTKVEKPKVTSATLKALERRRHRTLENKSSSPTSRITLLRGRLHSPRSGTTRVSPKDYRKLLTSAIDSGQARSKSPALSQSRVHRTETSLSENMDTNHLRSVRRCLYGKHLPGKSRSKSTVPPKQHPTTNKKL